jgi:glutamyl-tRNA synthetase
MRRNPAQSAHREEEAADWRRHVEGPVDQGLPVDGRPGLFLADAAQAAAGYEWAGNPWGELTAALKRSSGRGGKQLFLPLRKALTGRESGPEMAPLLLLIGKERTVERLREAAGG